MLRQLAHTSLPLHLVCFLLLFAVYFAFQWGATREERRRAREQKAILKRELDRLPKASRSKQ